MAWPELPLSDAGAWQSQEDALTGGMNVKLAFLEEP